MTELMVKLPDELAQRAKDAGFLSDTAILRLLDEAVRREDQRRLQAVAERIQVACIAPMSMAEMAAERQAGEPIESLFVTLLLVLAGVFSESEVLEVRAFVDAREYALALETTVDIFSEEKKLATEEIVALVSDLAVAMGLAPQTYTDRLDIE